MESIDNFFHIAPPSEEASLRRHDHSQQSDSHPDPPLEPEHTSRLPEHTYSRPALIRMRDSQLAPNAQQARTSYSDSEVEHLHRAQQDRGEFFQQPLLPALDIGLQPPVSKPLQSEIMNRPEHSEESMKKTRESRLILS